MRNVLDECMSGDGSGSGRRERRGGVVALRCPDVSAGVVLSGDARGYFEAGAEYHHQSMGGEGCLAVKFRG
jgi:hypothetical protein